VPYCFNCGQSVGIFADRCPNCGAAAAPASPKARPGESQLGCGLGCIGGFAMWAGASYLATNVNILNNTAAQATIYFSFAAVAIVILIPTALPIGRRFPVFVRWTIVVTLALYLGALLTCGHALGIF
jgi:hypothetical protein